MTTLGAPSILSVPTVTRWEKGTAKGSARGLVVINSNDDLPPGCFQIEASIGNVESHDHHAAQELHRRAHRGNEVWIVGPYSGHSVVLRARIINQDGQPGPPVTQGLPSTQFQGAIPSKKDKGSAKKRFGVYPVRPGTVYNGAQGELTARNYFV